MLAVLLALVQGAVTASTIPATECHFKFCAQTAAAVVLETRGSCEWSVGIDRSLLYYQNVFDATRPGKLLARSGACADDSGTWLRFSGPPNTVGVSYGIAAIADGALSGLPRLEGQQQPHRGARTLGLRRQHRPPVPRRK